MLVSILIPCFNAERWIAQAIDSALAQTWDHKEVVVLDDGSTDRSLEIIRGYGSAIAVESGPNVGGNRARNRLLAAARGEWLQFLDADDYLQPGKIAAQVQHIREHPGVDIVYSPITIEHWTEQHRRLEPLDIPEPHDPWILLARWFLPQTGATLWRKQAIIDVGGWTPDQPVCQEHDLYLRLLTAGRAFSYCDAHGAVWRVWGDRSLSFSRKTEQRRRRLVIESQAEQFLRSTGQLTPARHAAINTARLQIARVAWRERDREGASLAMRDLQQSDPDFHPAEEPWAYRVLLRSVGFKGAETIAGWRRALRA